MPSATESLDFWDEPLPAVLLRRLPRPGLSARPLLSAGGRSSAPVQRRRRVLPAGLRRRASVA